MKKQILIIIFFIFLFPVNCEAHLFPVPLVPLGVTPILLTSATGEIGLVICPVLLSITIELFIFKQFFPEVSLSSYLILYVLSKLIESLSQIMKTKIFFYLLEILQIEIGENIFSFIYATEVLSFNIISRIIIMNIFWDFSVKYLVISSTTTILSGYLTCLMLIYIIIFILTRY